MSEPKPPYKTSTIWKILDVEETELGAIRTKVSVTMDDYKKAQEELRVFAEMVDMLDALASAIEAAKAAGKL
jgi:hypothetical protein